MTVEEVTDIASSALFMVIKVAAPVLLVSLIVGLIISIFQTVTSIQEQTLTFVPKVIGNWMLTELSGYMVNLWSDFNLYVR